MMAGPENADDCRLRGKAMEFEEKYFKDMMLSRQLRNWGLDQYMYLSLSEWRFTIDPELDDCEGRTFPEEKKIVMRQYTDETLLHEMIHGYETQLLERYRQYLLMLLYDKLQKKMSKKKLMRCMYVELDKISTVFHTPLFLLKSFDLDYRRKLRLGTIYAYGRESSFAHARPNPFVKWVLPDRK